MKTISRILSLLVAVTLSLPLLAQAYTPQLEDKSFPVNDFTAVSADSDFDITLVKGEHGARLTTDKQLAPYVQIYVRSQTLFITYDEKSVPKDVRKLFRGRGAPVPVFHVVVTLPELGGVSLSDNAKLTGSEEFTGNHFELSLADKSRVGNLVVKAGSARVLMKKGSQAVLNLAAVSKVEVNAEGNSTLSLQTDTPELAVNADNGAVLNISGKIGKSDILTAGSSKTTLVHEPETAVVKMAGSSSLVLTGKAESMRVATERNAKLNAVEFPVKTLQAVMAGSSKAEVNVAEELEVTLQGGSALYYTGAPVFKINKIVKSTLSPLENK